MTYWVFTVGTKDYAPPLDWLVVWPHHVNEMWFPEHKKPVSVSRGDRALVYGSQGRGFIAAVEVLSEEPEPNTDPHYVWKLRYRLLVSKASDRYVASPADAGINPNRVVRGPHTEIDEDEYHRGVEVMLAAAARTAA
jgi:hypothetical protein